jgi:hypothetical protein
MRERDWGSENHARAAPTATYANVLPLEASRVPVLIMLLGYKERVPAFALMTP